MRIRRISGKKIMVFLLAVLCVSLAICGMVRENRLDHYQRDALAELRQNEGRYDEQYIVLYDTSRAKAEELARMYGADLRITENGQFARLELPEGITISDVFAMEESRAFLPEMAADYQVQISQLTESETNGRLPERPDYAISDADYRLQTYLDYLNMGSVWSGHTGTGITVAVIDTGIDTDHPEFAGRISNYSYNVTEDKIVRDYNDWSLVEDEDGHGTAVTGVLAASMNSGGVVGIAPNVEIIVIKAESDGKGNFARTSDLVFGLYYAIERDADVVNMSFGVYSPSNPFEAAAQLAYDSDIICVAAAGNESTSALCWPAADENVIGVGALGEGWTLADYSNYGENTDLVAPGSTYTALLGGKYGTMQGTSFSSPIVAGAVALYLQTSSYATYDEVTELLYASGYDLGALGRDWDYGFGALDIGAFILEARGTIIYDMLTDELENEEGIFIQGHTLQELPEPERLYAVFDGWYYDDTFTQEYNYYQDKFYGEVTLYARWVNEEDGIPYTYVVLEDGTVEIRSYTSHRRYLTIPDTIEGKTVSSIGDFAFSGQSRIREITLPSGLTQIGRYAFEKCTNLLHITIPASVKVIGESAFENNTRLTGVAFSGSSKLETIGHRAFADCGSLARIELPASVTGVEGSAFFGDVSLQSITVRSGNTAFSSQNGVLFNYSGSTLVAFPADYGTSYSIPSGTREIGEYAFGYSRLVEVDLGEIQVLGEHAFEYSSLQALQIPDSVTRVGKCAFGSNYSLTGVTLGRGLTELAGGMFADCISLKNIQIPSGIRTIGPKAFCSSGLTAVTFETNSELVQIGASAFAQCRLPEIDIPGSVLEIGAGVFQANPLTRVGFAENSELQVIGASAFEGCVLLQGIDLPENLRTIDDFAFKESGLKQITIPANVTRLGDGTFALCSALTGITIEQGNAVYHDIDGIVYDLSNTTIHTYPAGKSGSEYSLEATTEVVAPWAFAGSVNLNTATLPESLTQISEYGFSYCENLSNMHIPDHVLQIGRYAFAGNSNLFAVTFNTTSQLPRISAYAFAYSGLTSFQVPASVSTIAQYAFYGCENLTVIEFAENSKLESISAYMFDGCRNLQSLSFRNGSALTSIQAHGLEGMDRLWNVDFGNAKLKSIGNFAFRFCEDLSALNLPETVTEIGRYAFYSCDSLSELTIPAQVEHIGEYAFLGTNNLDLYFVSEDLPAHLAENWDHGIRGYYTGVASIEEANGYRYAVLGSGNIAILEYKGDAAVVDLTAVNLGAPITQIGGSAFKDSNVTSIVLPDTLTGIQAEAFAYSKLTSVTIPANVTFIGRSAFAHSDIRTLTFAKGSRLSVMEQYAFEGTALLSSVALPASLKTMGTGVFAESGLQSVTFAQGIGLTEIPKNAFANTMLASVALPDSVTLVNENAFSNVTTLKSVSFGSGNEIRLMSNAFYHTGLTSLHIPANVTYIGEYCFVALTKLPEYTVDAGNPNYTAVDGLLLSKDRRKLIAVPAGRTGSLTVPLSVEEIGFGAFEESKLSQVEFHENANILSLGYRAFFGADNLTGITIPNSVVAIDYYAFAYCENLQSVTFEEGSRLKGVYEGVFMGAAKLRDIELPESVVEISDFAFYGCSSLTELPVAQNHGLKGIYDYAFAHAGLSGEFTLPESIVDVGEYAFMATKITKLTIPEANKKQLIIGLGAFGSCNRLEEVSLPFVGASFEDEELSWFGYIFGAGKYTANNTYVPGSLKTVTITEGLTAVYEGGFYNCPSLETIHLPHSITQIGNQAFRYTTASYTLTNAIFLLDLETATSSYFVMPFSSGLRGELTLADGIESIGPHMFSGCTNLTDIILPDGLVSIQDSAFSGCESLVAITIPDNVVTIGEEAFANCYSLASVTLGKKLEYIGARAFNWCPDLTHVYNNSSLELTLGSESHGEIARYAQILIDSEGGLKYSDSNDPHVEYFYTDDGFLYRIEPNGSYLLRAYIGHEKTVKLPATVNGKTYSIGQFRSPSPIHVVLPDGMKKVDSGAFEGCRNLLSVSIPNSVTEIDANAFAGTGLQSVTIPDGVTRIQNNAFSSCEDLVTVSIPDSVSDIGSYAFSDCSSLMELYIPNSVVGVTPSAFSCNTNVIFEDGNERFQYRDGIIYNAEMTGIVYVNKTLTGTVVLPETLTWIDDQTFEGCTGLTEVVIPESVHGIGMRAFAGCTNLKRIELMGCNTIGNSAFAGCSSLVEVVLSDGLQSIRSNAFEDCAALSSIVIPDSVTVIDTRAFLGCTQLAEVDLPDNLEVLGSSVFWCCEALEHIEIPDDVISIEGYAFYYSGLKTIDLPDSVESIGAWAFAGCADLYSVTLGNNLQTIGYEAFNYCDSLENVVIPNSVTDIGANAFPRNTDVTLSEGQTAFKLIDGILYDSAVTTIIHVPDSVTGDLVIPDGVTMVQGFANLHGLTSVTIPDSVTYIDTQAFMNCTGLIRVDMGNGVTSMGESVFNGCTGLTQATLSNRLEKVGWSAFFGCSGLTGITIPESVTEIETNAFNECTNLYEVINLSAIPLTFDSYDNGYAGYYAKVFVDAEGNKTYRDPGSEFRYVDTDDGFRFMYENGEYKLIAYLGEEDTVTLPSDIDGNPYELYYFRGAKHVVIPENITEIGAKSFLRCNALSSVAVAPDHQTFCAVNGVLYDKDITQVIYAPTGLSGDISLPEGLKSIGGYAFQNCNRITSVTIPDGVTDIGPFAFAGCSGLMHVDLPGSLKQIEMYAFRDCVNLQEIHIPNGTEYIGDYAFYGCKSLSDVSIPASVKVINQLAFGGCTDWPNADEYWRDGMFIIDGWLILVDPEVRYLQNTDDIRGVLPQAYGGCSLLKNVVWTYAFMPSNVETVLINHIGSGTFAVSNSATLKNVVIKDSVKAGDLWNYTHLFNQLSGITIYVEAPEKDLRWDANFPGWSNGNTVVYGDEWAWANFYDENGVLISSEPRLNAQIIRLPVPDVEPDDEYTYTITGWDLDGDGRADTIPATSVADIEARPVIEASKRLYSVTFMDQTTGTVYHSVQLPRGSAISLPGDPEKRGFTFTGWSGHHADMKVTGDTVIYAMWMHNGDGHVYAEPVWVEATCTAQGYYKHTCTICGEYYGTGHTAPRDHTYQSRVIAATCTTDGYTLHTCATCGESYKDAFVSASGTHTYGGWIIDVVVGCSKEGKQHRICETCGHREDLVIEAGVHNFVVVEQTESSCSVSGTCTYRCETCGKTTRETLPLKSHNYEKKHVSMSFLEWLIRLLMDVLWGYEGDRTYYFACADCGHVQTRAEMDSTQGGTASSGCMHSNTRWKEESGCVGDSKYLVCEKCGEVLEVYITGEGKEHSYTSAVTAPTCSEEGYTTYTCRECGDCYTDDYVEPLGHDWDSWVTITEATTTQTGLRRRICKACDAQQEEILPVLEIRCGDVNSDGKVNTEDRLLLTRYLAKWAGYTENMINMSMADVNGDGKVNALDRLILTRYLAKWEGYESLPCDE